MPKYRDALPQLDGGLFLTDGGIETVLVFHEGLDLPYFAAFDLLKSAEGRAILDRYFRNYIQIARDSGLGFVLESATWRASPDWAEKLGYDRAALAAANRRAIAMLEDFRAEFETARLPMVISGCVGPRGDGYAPEFHMTAAEAEAYHGEQIGTFAGTAADMVTAITITYADEATGITRAAQAAGLPVAVSFTVETDGRLPSGQGLKDAIAQVDAATGDGPAYFMLNCAHPTHFQNVLAAGEPWLDRIRGLRANASTKSHAELDESTELDAGNPEELGRQYRALRHPLRRLSVLGGCCGTDHRHVAAISQACLAA